MSSSICTHFSQNAWKKDLCSNCFKSKDEHKQAAAALAASRSKYTSISTSLSASLSSKSTASSHSNDTKSDYPNKNKKPAKSIIKRVATSATTLSSTTSSSKTSSKHKSHKVSFPKNLSEVIGYGGEWSDDSDDDHDFMNLANDKDDDKALGTDDEESLELKRITRANTDFNMNNGNLLGDPQENIKKTFAALKLGAPQVDKEGKKQTLQINVLPFGAASDAKETTQSSKTQIATTSSSNTSKSSVKAKFESKTETKSVVRKTTTTAISSTSTTTSASSSSKLITDPMPSLESDGKNSPPIERAMEKSLLDEISETLEKNQTAEKLATEQKSSGGNSGNTTTTSSSSSASSTGASNKIKFEIGSLAESLENKTFLDLKKPIVRHTPITKDQIKPKVNVFNKYCDSDSNCSDTENGVSAYYDVVETSTTYENLPDGKYEAKEVKKSSVTSSSKVVDQTDTSSSIFSTSQYITDMLLSSKTRAASYNLHEGNFMTSKITSDGLIVTKCSSDDALDSTGSSFDGSSDEETSYNMIRSESDSGIGISIGHDYKNIHVSEKERDRLRIEKKLSASTNNSDYEDIQVNDQRPSLPLKEGKKADKPSFSLEKSRELHGEPDGSADPDGSLENQDNQELPALPKSPPPSTKVIDARPSFLHGLQKQHPPILLKKPDLPVKPLVSPSSSPMKSFLNKRSPAGAAATADQQQVISQLQMIMSKTLDTQTDCDAVKDESKLKKGKAPNPPPSASGGIEQKSSAPPTPERDYSLEEEFSQEQRKETYAQPLKKQEETPKPSPPSPQESKAASNSATESGNASPAASMYTRKIGAMTSAGTVGKNSAAAAAIREKDKRDRAVINPKFRSLNTFATQRSNAIKNLQLQNATSSISFNQSMTPEAKPRNPKSLSASEENLNAEAAASKMVTPSMSITNIAAASQSSDKKSSTSSSPSAKTKTKFSIKKFLRMGASKTTENLSKPSKESIYSEICTGEDMGVSGKPRLVIIHPIDINTTAVEVVKDITKTNDAVATQTVAVVTAKPPAPPLRSLDTQRNHEMNKPARPPPPKSAELRRKQQIALTTSSASSSTATATAATSAGTTGGSSVTSSPKTSTSSSSSSAAGNNIRIIGEQQSGSIKSKSDNVYANLGEIRSSIAPRKPERTASMREREAQLELARKRHIGGGAQHQGNSNGKENVDTISICSSNGDMVSADQQQQHSTNPNGSNTTTSTSTTTNASKNLGNIIKTALAGQLSGSGGGGSRLEGKPPTGSRTSTFERKKNEAKPTISNKLEIFENGGNGGQNNSDTCSIASDGRTNSLKDSVRKINSTIDNYLKDKRDYENMYELVKSPASPPPPPARSADLQATQRLMQARRRELDTISVASYTRSEYGPVRNFGLNTSLANIPRMISASYCGSEMGDLDIYSPYSYYGSEAGGDLTSDINDSVWGSPSGMKNRVKATNRLRMRKGRSVVHKTIEDNYSAVVGANHEALAQVLEQLQQTPIIPPALRPLANAINLRFEDFTILEGAQAFVVGKKAFHAALWTTAPVTLALSADCNQLAGIGGELSQLSGGVSGALNPITEFCDIVPSFNLPLMPTTEVTLLQATISVLPRLQLDTLQSIGAILKGKSHVLDKSNFNFRGSIPNLTILKDTSSMAGLGSVSAGLRNGLSVQNLTTLSEETAGAGDMSLKLAEQQDQQQQQVTSAVTTNGIPAFDDVMTREVAFIMLQLINGMKHLQVKAVEEMPLSLSNVVLSKEYDNKDAQARLCVLQGNHHDEDEPMGTLCKCAHIALTEMLPSTKMTPILANILQQDRSESLSKSKSVLEFILWGPSDVQLTGSTKERETALQRWLDLERATVLHGLVRTRVELTVYDECHLMFLVRSTAKIMNDAAKIIANYQEHQQQQMKSNQLTKD
uniref:Serine-rich adhesin for platelets n=1 Tax=Stomoxys calcitrans TaxID=35570 RepID=A0A1I8QAH5_STOCA